jgi:hypothetical protein
MDRVKAASSTAEALRTRLAKGAERSGKSSRELVGRLALQLHLTKEGIRDVFEAAPIEVALLVEPALERAGQREAARAWCRQLIAMYRAWAGNRHMQLAELAGRAAHELPLLLISGFGAHRLLEKEAGLHVLEQAGRSRATARVQLAVTPLGDPPLDRLRRALQAALEGAAKPHGAPLPQRARAPGAQHERGLAHRPPRRRPRRQLRPDRGELGGRGLGRMRYPCNLR